MPITIISFFKIEQMKRNTSKKVLVAILHISPQKKMTSREKSHSAVS